MSDSTIEPSPLQVLTGGSDSAAPAPRLLDVLKQVAGRTGGDGGTSGPIAISDVTGLSTALNGKANTTDLAAFDTDLTAAEGRITTAETKLAGIAPNATANRTDTATDNLLNAKAALDGARFTGRVSGVPQVLVDAVTTILDGSKGNFFTWTIGGNRALSITNLVAGQSYSVRIKQDTTGGRVITWPAGFVWPGGTIPVLSTAANAVDILSFIAFSATVLDGNLLKDMK